MPYATLISCAQLAERLAAQPDSCVVFDCRHDLAKPEAGAAAYAEAHVPGARFMHLDRDMAGPLTGRNGRHPLPDPETFAAKLRAAGVNADSQVIAYDDSGGMYAARLWWMLRWLGHDAVAVLDGGWKQWLSEGRATDSEIPVAKAGSFTPRQGTPGVDVHDVLSHLGKAGMQIVDARAEDRYRGENETMDPVAGHIPGALNRAFRHNLDAGGRFKQSTQLKQEFQAVLGGIAPAQVVHQCGSGVTACHNLLAMEIAGLAGSRLYPGSWSEWCSDASRPIARGDLPGG